MSNLRVFSLILLCGATAFADDLRLAKAKAWMQERLDYSVLQYASGQRRLYLGTAKISNLTRQIVLEEPVIGFSEHVGRPIIYLVQDDETREKRRLLVRLETDWTHWDPQFNPQNLDVNYQLSMNWDSDWPWIGTANGIVPVTDSTKISTKLQPFYDRHGQLADYGLLSLATKVPLSAQRPESVPSLPFEEALQASLELDVRAIDSASVSLRDLERAEPPYSLAGGIAFAHARKAGLLTESGGVAVYRVRKAKEELSLVEARQIDPTLSDCPRGKVYVFHFAGKMLIPVNKIAASSVVIEDIGAPICDVAQR